MKTNRSVFVKEVVDNAAYHRHLFMLLLTILLLALFFSAFAQSSRLETEKGLEEAIAPFDANVRAHILVASEYPEVLKQLRNSQTQTAETFQRMISRFRQKKQEWFYTITRYPELMHRLANLPAKQTQEEINKILPNQDPDLKEAAWKLYKNEKKSLARLDNIRMNANAEFERSISHLNSTAREAFHHLQSKPDVLTVLTNNIDLTARLGDHYKNNPAEVSNQLAALHDKLELQNERDAAAFKKQMESDPKAMKELRQASNAYNANPYYSPYYYPYSYWFGYPYWYGYPMWYPGMFWGYPGFYFGLGGLYGFPSYGFSFWFYNGGYYTRYPRLYRSFTTYYQNNNVPFTRTGATITTANNRGFMNVATSHYQPNARIGVGATSPYSFRQTNVSGFNRVHTNTSGYMNQTHSLGNFGGRSGMGVGGALGGGFHGGGRHR
jgi:hypothetical protein